jgi:hypothetical protein
MIITLTTLATIMMYFLSKFYLGELASNKLDFIAPVIVAFFFALKIHSKKFLIIDAVISLALLVFFQYLS